MEEEDAINHAGFRLRKVNGCLVLERMRWYRSWHGRLYGGVLLIAFVSMGGLSMLGFRHDQMFLFAMCGLLAVSLMCFLLFTFFGTQKWLAAEDGKVVKQTHLLGLRVRRKTLQVDDRSCLRSGRTGHGSSVLFLVHQEGEEQLMPTFDEEYTREIGSRLADHLGVPFQQ